MIEIVLILLYAAVMILPRLIIIPLAVHAVVIVLSALDYGRIPLVGLHDTLGFLARGDADAEAAQYRLLFFGYLLFSIAMIFGGIWAQLAWGTYWLWTPKELWTTIVWFWYGLYLHARLVKGWSGLISSAMGSDGCRKGWRFT